MADLIDTPSYFGSADMLKAPRGLKVHTYFETTRIEEWNLRDFLICNSNVGDFLGSIERLWKTKSVDGTVRAFACAWNKHLSGEAGKLRIEVAKESAINEIRNAKLTEKERALVQTNVEN